LEDKPAAEDKASADFWVAFFANDPRFERNSLKSNFCFSVATPGT